MKLLSTVTYELLGFCEVLEWLNFDGVGDFIGVGFDALLEHSEYK
jgi:hypothetical protein